MSEPRRCRFCDEPLGSDAEGAECDAGCRAGFTLFMHDEDEAEPDDDPYSDDSCGTLPLSY